MTTDSLECRLVEAYCTNCGKTIEITKIPKGESGIMSAQFLKCPECHKNKDFAYFQISTRDYQGDLTEGFRSLKKENYGQWVSKTKGENGR